VRICLPCSAHCVLSSSTCYCVTKSVWTNKKLRMIANVCCANKNCIITFIHDFNYVFTHTHTTIFFRMYLQSIYCGRALTTIINKQIFLMHFNEDFIDKNLFDITFARNIINSLQLFFLFLCHTKIINFAKVGKNSMLSWLQANAKKILFFYVKVPLQ
jgi:hypothetical protein